MIKAAAYDHDIRGITHRLSRFIVTTHLAVRLVLRLWTPHPLRPHLVRVSVTPAVAPLRPSSASCSADAKLVTLTTSSSIIVAPERMSLYLG
jgi:hypothetical protein